MRLSHTVGRMSALFDEPNLIGSAGLVPAVALADRIGLAELVDRVLTVPGAKGCAGVKVTSVLAGMLAGADSIDDLDVLRHGAMGKLFGGVRAPSTLGTFLRSFRFGHVLQLDAVASRAVGLLAGRFAAAERLGRPIDAPPATTALGALIGHITGGHIDAGKGSFQPMNINYGLLPPLDEAGPKRREDGSRIGAKERGRNKKLAMGERALADLDAWVAGAPALAAE